MNAPVSLSTSAFPVWLFTHDPAYAAAAVAAGAQGVIVDWEWQDKTARQVGRDTEVNHGTDEHLRTMRAAVRGPVACRINNLPRVRRLEAVRAAALGADEVWLPMVRSVAEIEECLQVLPANCRLGILAETPEALLLAREFNQLPLSRVYFGLNDLWISSQRSHLFSALVDGTVDKFRGEYTGLFGVAGITRPTGGSPVPCRLLLAEMARLRCDFGVARRAFRRDSATDDLPLVIGEIHSVLWSLAQRSETQISADRQELESCVQALETQGATR